MNTEQIQSDLDEYDQERVNFLVEYIGLDPSEALENYEDVDFYQGTNLQELAEQFVDDGLFGEIPENLVNYIDYDAIARDLQHDYTEVSGKGCFRYD